MALKIFHQTLCCKKLGLQTIDKNKFLFGENIPNKGNIISLDIISLFSSFNLKNQQQANTGGNVKGKQIIYSIVNI